MGIFDPSRNDQDKNKDVQINSISLFDDKLGLDTIGDWHNQIQRTLSKTNDITLDALGTLKGLTNGVGSILGAFDDTITGSLLTPRISHKPNEIVTKGIPPPEVYDECKKAEGLGVWDQYGLWHCLFPRSSIPYDYHTGRRSDDIIIDDSSLVSREDIENDVDHKYGTFFKNMEDMLGWQSSMKRAIQEQKRRQWADWEKKEKSKWGFLTGFTNGDDSSEDDEGKTVVGRESETRVVTLPNGDLERTTVMRRRYSDGTSKVREFSEIIGPDGEVKK